MTALETIKQFYEALGKDTQMQGRMKELDFGNPQDKETAMAVLINFAAREGYSFTAEEAAAYIENRHKGEVTDEELEGIAGAGSGIYDPGCRYVGWDVSHYVHEPWLRDLIDNCRFECPYCIRNNKHLPLYDE
jgi:sulfatase maturation enzyme AslB (radical SAM superfamily)